MDSMGLGINSSRGGGGRHLKGGQKFCTLRGRGRKIKSISIEGLCSSSDILEWGLKCLHKSERGTKIASNI